LEWTPSTGQEGEYSITFTATDSAGLSSTSHTRIFVDSGKPVITGSAHLACSSESIATLHGRWLSQNREEFSSPDGTSTSLAGVTVRIDGTPVPILFADQQRVDFLCPAASAKPVLTLETGSGVTAPLPITLLEANPALLSVRALAGNRGYITSLETGSLTTLRDFRDMGQPARRDELVSIRATGLGDNFTTLSLFSVKVAETPVEITQITPAPNEAGVYVIQARMPAAAPLGDAVPLRLEMLSPAGRRLTSNQVTVAIE
jgi:uncharacterized protein (TIGR03437 family)